MAEFEKIEDLDQLENWLKTQDARMSRMVAARASLRSLSAAMAVVDQKIGSMEGKDFVLSCLRATLISEVASTCRTPDMKRVEDAALAALSALYAARSAAAALSADPAARSAARSALSALYAAARSAALAAARSAARSADLSADPAVRSAAICAAFSDAEKGRKVGHLQVFTEALWSDAEQVQDLLSFWEAFAARPDPKGHWAFWRAWYAGMLAGKPLDWDLQLQVALIKPKVWDAGVEAVAEEIARIEAEFLAAKLPQAEDIARDPQDEDGRYAVSPVVLDADAMIGRLFDQLRFALQLALRGHNVSGFNEMCVSYKYLEHTFDCCRDDPNAVHMHLRFAREIIQGNLKTGVYREEDALKALVDAMERHEIQLRADHPEVRKAHDTFLAQKLRELDQEQRLQLAEEFRGLQPDSKGRLSEEFGLDAEVLEADAAVEAQADAVKRSGGRSQKMALSERAGSAVKKVDGSAANKGLGLLLRLQKIADIISQLM